MPVVSGGQRLVLGTCARGERGQGLVRILHVVRIERSFVKVS